MAQLRVIMGIISFILQIVSILIALGASPIVYHFYSNYHFYSRVESRVESVSGELKYIQERVESLTQHPQDMNILRELKYIRERVESLTQHPQDMNILRELKYIRERVESLQNQQLEEQNEKSTVLEENRALRNQLTKKTLRSGKFDQACPTVTQRRSRDPTPTPRVE